ncbi:MAG: biotin/lipoyl-binding protein [Calditrichaeota bacterium]|nr:MAG: biotin/lipoyl-binding protein [Calditrichota bacterium]
MNKTAFHLLLLGLRLCCCSPQQEEMKTFPLHEASPVSPVRVETAKAIRSTLIEHISTTGVAQAQRCLVIRPQVQGYIKHLPIIEGQTVTPGQILIELDKQDLELNLKEAHAEYLRSCIEYGKKQGEFRNSLKLNFLSSDFAFLDLEEAKLKYQKTVEEFAADRISEIEMLRAQA